MAARGTYRWQKTTDINRKHPLFELLDGETPVLDAGYTDDEVFEVAFNSSIGGRVIDWDQFVKLLEEGRSLAELDR
ncbi:hypothetical protein CCZ27_07545 [Thauera sinica]|nr:hypothetical protein CCZ27_07545 [Thauera sp. K11]